MTVGELIEELSSHDENAEVRLAMQPSWPFEYSISCVVVVEGDEDHLDTVFIAEGSQLNYLSEEARDILGW